MTDVVDPKDIDIYRNLAGGVTTMQLLHGSANPIGGRSAILRLKWGEDADGPFISQYAQVHQICSWRKRKAKQLAKFFPFSANTYGSGTGVRQLLSKGKGI